MKVLIYSKQKALINLKRDISPEDTCYYLCDDYLTYLKIGNTLSNKYKILLPEKIFHDVIEEIKEEFLLFCHLIGNNNEPDIYWDTHLASRNSSSIPLLKYLVYFYCAQRFLLSRTSRIIFICDSVVLANMIQKKAEEKGFSCEIRFSALDQKGFIKIYAYLLMKAGYFLLSNILEWLYAKTLKNKRLMPNSEDEAYILRSWITAGCLDGLDNYKDRNFGILPDYLKNQGKNIWILPMFFNLDRSIFSQMRLMARNETNFLFPQQYLSFLDILKALRDGIKTVRLNLNGIKFRGTDVSLLVRQVHLKTCIEPSLLSLNMVKYVMRNLSRKAIKLNKVIYPIENNPPEKSFILAVRKYYPDVKVLGFQHTVWLKEQLAMFLSQHEISCHPLPDKIICSGKRYLDILKQAGFPGNIIELGCNLRYTAVNQDLPIESTDEAEAANRILIILNFSTDQNMELLDKVRLVLKELKEVRIYIKSHPLSPAKELIEFLEYIEFPRYDWAIGTIQELFARVNAVIMTAGSVSNLETIGMGVPLLRVSLGSNFDFDPLWDEYPFFTISSSIVELKHSVEKAFTMNNHERKSLRAFGRKMVEDYFEPTTTEYLRSFL